MKNIRNTSLQTTYHKAEGSTGSNENTNAGQPRTNTGETSNATPINTLRTATETEMNISNESVDKIRIDTNMNITQSKDPEYTPTDIRSESSDDIAEDGIIRIKENAEPGGETTTENQTGILQHSEPGVK